MTHPDVPAEQAHVDLAYERLAAMRAAAAAMLQDAFGERGGTFQAITERDIRVRNSLSRLEQLEIGRESLVFGRIDRAGRRCRRTAPTRATESFHIGRLAISDQDQEPLVVDWRAPVAEPFYRATGAHPMGLTRRRHFLTEGQRVLDLEDELFDAEGSDPGVGLGPVRARRCCSPPSSGPAPAACATSWRPSSGSRTRSSAARCPGSWSSRVVRAPARRRSPCTGPPTCSTPTGSRSRARASWSSGPNPTFLRYIEHVLPSLDESGVELSTVNGLFRRSRPTGREDEDTPGSRATPAWPGSSPGPSPTASARCGGPSRSPSGRGCCGSPRSLSAQVVGGGQAAAGHPQRPPPDARGPALAAAARAGRRRCGRVRPTPETAGEPLTAEELGRDLRRQPEVAAALERMWPILTPQQLLHDLFGAPPLIDLAAAQVLDSGRAPAPAAAPAQPGRRRCAGPTPTSPCSTRPGPCSGRRAAGPAPTRERRRPDLRPRGRRRGPGPVADAVAHGRPPVAVGLDDRGRRHRPGDRHRGCRRRGPRWSSTCRPAGVGAWSSSPSTTAPRARSWSGRPDPRAGGARDAAARMRSGPAAARPRIIRAVASRPDRSRRRPELTLTASAVRDELDGVSATGRTARSRSSCRRPCSTPWPPP